MIIKDIHLSNIRYIIYKYKISDIRFRYIHKLSSNIFEISELRNKFLILNEISYILYISYAN